MVEPVQARSISIEAETAGVFTSSSTVNPGIMTSQLGDTQARVDILQSLAAGYPYPRISVARQALEATTPEAEQRRRMMDSLVERISLIPKLLLEIFFLSKIP